MDKRALYRIFYLLGCLSIFIVWKYLNDVNFSSFKEQSSLEMTEELEKSILMQFLEEDCLKPDEMKLKKYEGKLNLHRWMDSCPCGTSIDRALRIHSRFPREPEPSSNELRKTDFLRQFDKDKKQTSEVLSLHRGQDYYIEVLHRSERYHGYVSIAWQKPWTTEFIVIESRHLSLFLPDDGEFPSPDHKECILQDHKPLLLKVMPSITRRQLTLEKDDICLKYELVDHSIVSDVLDTCPYQPSYMPKHKIGHYHGANFYAGLWLTDFYPNDKTLGIFKDYWHGNNIIDKKEVVTIVEEYMKKLKSSLRQKYELKKILNVEKKRDKNRGNRYLLELELSKKDRGKPDQSVLLSEYVFKFNKSFLPQSSKNLSTQLCYPDSFQWKNSAKVYIILPVKNFGYWVKYLIDELIKVYNNTPEKNFHLVIIDFNSTDFNAKEYLRNSFLNNSFTVLTQNGQFQKALAINHGAESVKDPNAILFLMDLHITIPPCFFDIIRKHTIKGKSGFFPNVLRLQCSTSDIYPDGFWDITGYGLLGIYKQDWDRFGGEDAEKYKFSWGGEDWSLLDRVLNAKIESERFKWPKMFHFPHSKEGNWYKNTWRKHID